MAIACLPQQDEVLDGRVIEVMATGITVQSGPIKTFISLKVSNPFPNPFPTLLTLVSPFLERPIGLRVRDLVEHVGDA